MKRYIKPSTDITAVELQQIMQASLNKGTNAVSDESLVLGKDHDFFGFDSNDSDPTPRSFNVWED